MGPFKDGWSKLDVQAVLEAGTLEYLAHVPIAISMDPPDAEWALSICLRLAEHPDSVVRGNAILAFGHLARTTGQLDQRRVLDAVTAALTDASSWVRGHANSAAQDIAVYLGWKIPGFNLAVHAATLGDRIWNRAAMEAGGPNPQPGDAALCALLQFHGMAMNGGVVHAIEALGASELRAARDGFEYFGMAPLSELVGRAIRAVETAHMEKEDDLEIELDRDYEALTEGDAGIEHSFRDVLKSTPDAFAPLANQHDESGAS